MKTSSLIILGALLCGCGCKTPRTATTQYHVTYQFKTDQSIETGEWYFNVKKMDASTIAEIKAIILAKTTETIVKGTNGIIILNAIRMEP